MHTRNDKQNNFTFCRVHRFGYCLFNGVYCETVRRFCNKVRFFKVESVYIMRKL